MLKKAESLALLLALAQFGGESGLEGDDLEEGTEEEKQKDWEEDQGPDEGNLLKECSPVNNKNWKLSAELSK